MQNSPQPTLSWGLATHVRQRQPGATASFRSPSHIAAGGRKVLLALMAVLGLFSCGTSATPKGNANNDSGIRSPDADTSSCDGSAFEVITNAISPKMATVGIVEGSFIGELPSSAKVVFRLKDAESSTLNRGGEAPIDFNAPNYRTRLLGLKQSRDYTFHVELMHDGTRCVSPEFSLPKTGSFPNSPAVSSSVIQATKREPGFIVTSSGTFFPDSAFIIDADGDVVWYAPGPLNTSRAQMDYEGNVMWMVSLNMINTTGEMRSIAMDGEQEQRNIPGLQNAHHDLTVLPGGKVATLVWVNDQVDPESDLVIHSPDGSLSTPFRVGHNLYRSDAFHANALHYNPLDGSFTIADRNPNVFVKVSADGTPEWQIGGVCDGAPVQSACFPMDWQVVHGHHLLEDGTLLAFNNGYTGPGRVFEFKVDLTPGSFNATQVKEYEGTASSFNMGDVQRLPGGNTLVTYSTDAKIVELDANWNEVQTFSARVGYTNWRPTLYGPPTKP